MITRAQRRKQQGKRDVTMERIQAYARGESWNEEEDAVAKEEASDEADEADEAPALEEESEFEEEEGKSAASARRRKRGRAAKAKAGTGSGAAPKKRRRAAGRQKQGQPDDEVAGHAVQRLPLGAIKQIGLALDFDTRLSLSTTCHLARETLFNARNMEQDWIKAYARKRARQRTVQRDGSKTFALTAAIMQRNCPFEERYMKRGRWKYLFNMPDLFRCAMQTHGGWKGFIAALERRKRRSDAQYRAIELRPVREAVKKLQERIECLPEDLEAAAGALARDVDGLQQTVRQRQVDNLPRVQQEIRGCEARMGHLGTAAKLLGVQARLQLRPDGIGVDEEELNGYLQRLEQMRQRCAAAASEQELPARGDLACVVREGDAVQKRVETAIRSFASRGVDEFLRQRRCIESRWSVAQRDRFIRGELDRFGLNPDPPRSRLLEAYADNADSGLTSEIVLGVRAATDDIADARALRHIPPNLSGMIQMRLRSQLASEVQTQDHEPWQPARDDLIRRFIRIGLNIASGVIDEAYNSADELDYWL